jgi:lauroyl/myristoyl acyltransferase
LTSRYKRVSDWAYFFGVTPALALLPKKLGYPLMQRQGRHICRVNPIHRQNASRNISLVLDDEQWSALAKTQVVTKTFEVMVAEDLDTFYFPFWNENNIRRCFSFEGLDHIDRARRQRRGVLMFTGHFGSICSSLVALSLRGYTLNHLSRDSRNETSFHPAFRAYARCKLAWMKRKTGRDMLFIDADQGTYSQLSSASAIIEAYRLLSQNEIVSMAVDVPPQMVKRTAKVEFLGRECLFPTGLISLAYQSKAPVIPYFVLRDKDAMWRQTVLVQEPIPMSGNVKVDLQKCVDRLGDMIREHPEQWYTWDSLSLFWADPGTADASAA